MLIPTIKLEGAPKELDEATARRFMDSMNRMVNTARRSGHPLHTDELGFALLATAIAAEAQTMALEGLGHPSVEAQDWLLQATVRAQKGA